MPSPICASRTRRRELSMQISRDCRIHPFRQRNRPSHQDRMRLVPSRQGPGRRILRMAFQFIRIELVPTPRKQLKTPASRNPDFCKRVQLRTSLSRRGRKAPRLVSDSPSAVASREATAAKCTSFWGGVRGGPFCKKGLPGYFPKNS